MTGITSFTLEQRLTFVGIGLLAAFVEETTYFGKADRANHPINCVDWSRAERFCAARNKRLPTEAEWEFAARGSDGRKFPWGDDEGTAKHMNAGGLEFTQW